MKVIMNLEDFPYNPRAFNLHTTSGPWSLEVNSYSTVDEKTGYKIAIIRSSSGFHLCGYVQVPRNHPAYYEDENSKLLKNIEVHGGITFCNKGWFGFDCAHHGDYTLYNRNGTYRTFLYVLDQCLSLAAQLYLLENSL